MQSSLNCFFRSGVMQLSLLAPLVSWHPALLVAQLQAVTGSPGVYVMSLYPSPAANLNHDSDPSLSPSLFLFSTSLSAARWHQGADQVLSLA